MVEIIRRFIFAGIAAGLIAGNSDDITKFFDDIKAYSGLVATSGDMRTFSLMLDYHYLQKGRYPSEKNFQLWVKKNFKENNLKENSRDHWGQKYIYKTSNRNKSYRLISTGRDKIKGTLDDIEISGP